jgi:hypothetical protein
VRPRCESEPNEPLVAQQHARSDTKNSITFDSVLATAEHKGFCSAPIIRVYCTMDGNVADFLVQLQINNNCSIIHISCLQNPLLSHLLSLAHAWPSPAQVDVASEIFIHGASHAGIGPIADNPLHLGGPGRQGTGGAHRRGESGTTPPAPRSDRFSMEVSPSLLYRASCGIDVSRSVFGDMCTWSTELFLITRA